MGIITRRLKEGGLGERKNNEGVRLNKKAWGEKRKKIEQKNTLKNPFTKQKHTKSNKGKEGSGRIKKHFSE